MRTYTLSFGKSVYYRHSFEKPYCRKIEVKGREKAERKLLRLNRCKFVDWTDCECK